MNLEPWPRVWSRRTKATKSVIFHTGKNLSAHTSGTVSLVLLQEVFEQQEPILSKQEAVLFVAARFIVTGAHKGLSGHAQFKATRMMPGFSVIPESRLADKFATYDARAFCHREIAMLVDHISDWGTVSRFADGFHPRIGP